MNGFSLILIGYALGATLALLVLLSMRRTTTQPTIVFQQERPQDDSLGCGAFFILVAMIGAGVLVALALG